MTFDHAMQLAARLHPDNGPLPADTDKMPTLAQAISLLKREINC
jgi:hypothetical protein